MTCLVYETCYLIIAALPCLAMFFHLFFVLFLKLTCDGVRVGGVLLHVQDAAVQRRFQLLQLGGRRRHSEEALRDARREKTSRCRSSWHYRDLHPPDRQDKRSGASTSAINRLRCVQVQVFKFQSVFFFSPLVKPRRNDNGVATSYGCKQFLALSVNVP